MLEINGYSIKEITDLVNDCGLKKAENIIENNEIISKDFLIDDIERMIILDEQKKGD